MKESEEEDLIHKDCPEQSFDPEISDLGNLINTILDYYTFTQSEEGEEWKKGTSHEHKIVPDEVSKLVEQAFKTQLKKFIKK